jgi:WD40 repeat protein
MHTATIHQIAVDAHSRWLVTASEDKTARVWDLKSGRLVNVIRPPLGTNEEGKLHGAAISPDGEVVALGGWTQFNDGRLDMAPEGAAVMLFDRATGRMLRRIEGIKHSVNRLAYSPDGYYLAATLFKEGVRVYEADNGELIGQDTEYGGETYGADFSSDGRLVTSSIDGYVRVYRLDKSGLHLAAKMAAPGGKEPFGVRFSPDGRLIAVGYEDSVSVSVLDSVTLAFRYAPQSSGSHGSLAEVAWSFDGQFLYAGGSLHTGDGRVIKRWPQAGRAPPVDTVVATNSVMDLRPLPQSALVYASANPDWGVLDANGQRTHVIAAPTADLRDFAAGFMVSHDGRAVRFSFKERGAAPDPGMARRL